jgi:hypothetical protein
MLTEHGGSPRLAMLGDVTGRLVNREGLPGRASAEAASVPHTCHVARALMLNHGHSWSIK